MSESSVLADQLFDIWKHAGHDECVEQIEAHMESDGFSRNEIDIAIENLEPSFDAAFGI